MSDALEPVISDENNSNRPTRIMFLYWGRRGLSRFVYEIARVATSEGDLQVTISVSQQNEIYRRFEEFEPNLFAVDTFANNIGALTSLWRIPGLRKKLNSRIRKDRIEVVIELMPHVWSGFIASSIKQAGARYVTIVHDAYTHPGDSRSKWARFLLDYACNQADTILAMSEAVAYQFKSKKKLLQKKPKSLFLPDLEYTSTCERRQLHSNGCFRLLFMGRIMPYKGLPLFLDAVEILRAQNIQIEIGVYGEGNLGDDANRLAKMGATVVNRWLSEVEIAEILPEYDAMVLSHIEASQSGIAAIALGNGLPIIGTPVGGLPDQIKHRKYGIVADSVSAGALAEAIKELLFDPDLFSEICQNINASRGKRSMRAFVRACVELTKPEVR